ncbi:proprotein convertase P-domain-containing protein [Parvicella tangerina]|uniref:T9SS C-terminal target domain-containing protein n=1 Tax=Parvicella tangerina TaxID=2829795 RepID=A0A916JLE8_9FLAO|nr:proprotein convertase P-domain-containing protein [Parvicella tangerina]CAG5079237.1 hypothetical protein CRYO30217_00894 [Parvicella tangerina]
MKKLALTLAALIFFSWNISAQTCASETFTNIGPYGGYQTENWTGDDGIGWTATDARTDQTITGKAITIRNGSLLSGTFAGGIGDLTVTTQRKFSGGTGNLSVEVNGTPVGTVPFDATVTTTTISGINITGNVIIEIINSTGDRVAIDDLTWTCYTGGGSNTDSEFSSASGSVAENAGTFNLPLTINNPSGSASTTTTIELTSGNASMLSNFAAVGSTDTETTPASGTTDSYTLNIVDNGTCDGAETFVFTITNVTGGQGTPAVGTQSTYTLTISDDEQASGGTLFAQDFDSGTTWGYSTAEEGDEAFWGITNSLANVNYASITGNFWGLNDINDNDIITFNSVNVSGVANVGISFDYDVFEFDSGDDVFYEVFIDGVGQGSVQLINGSSNYSEEGNVDIPIGTATTVSLTLSITQNGGSDYAGFDNFTVYGDYCPCVAPTTQPNSINFSSITSTSMQISWTDAGDGDSQIVLVHEGSAVDSGPVNGTGYTADNDWSGAPDEIGTGNFVMYTGDGGPVTVTNLNPNTDYYVAIYEYNTADDCYYLTSPLTGNTTTLCDDPTAQPTSVSFSSVTSTGFTVDWTGGNGTNSIVLVHEGSAVDADPVDGTSYTADNDFSGTPDEIGTGNFVVYNGTGASVSVTGLTPNVTYHVAVYEFNSSSDCYNTTSPTTGNQTTPCPSPPDNVSGFAVTAGNQSASITWTNPAYCFDEVLIVAEDGTIGFTPSGNGSGYTANPTYGSGTCVDCSGSNNEYVVYKGVGTSVNVTGLTNGVSYCFKVWTRNGTDWSLQDVVCSVVPTAAIPDDGCALNDNVEMTFNYSGTNPIADIDVDVFIEHTYRGDLQIEVESPTGTIVTIFDGQGAGAANLEATFDDGSANTTYTTDHTLDGAVDEILQTTGGTLATFNGETPTGTWIIRVCDDAGADTGVLNGWSITIVESCTPTHSVSSFAPTSGPEGTAVTITGTGFTTSTTADIGGIAATVQFVSSTSIIVEIPAGATDNTIDIDEGGCTVSTASNFTLISTAGLCGGSTSFSDLIISEVYDSDAANVWYIELFNPTGSAIDLGAENYTIERYATAGDASPTRTISLSGVIPAGGVFLLNIGTSANTCTETWDFTEAGAGINENDGIMLVHNGTDVDWVECPGNTGYSITRDVAASGPTTTWNAADWTINNVETCADLGSFGVVYDTHPSITSEPNDSHACSILKDITAAAGSGGGALTYQWYYNDGSAAGWSTVTAGAFPLATVSGETSANLSITGNASDIETYNGYQFYCVCTEDGSCSTASDAAQFRARSENDPEMITAMVNSCDAICGAEGYNEFFALEIGNVAIDVSNAANVNVSYGTSYPASTTFTDAFTADGALTASFNAAAGCSLFQDAVTVGTIPAHSTVLLMSNNVCASAYDFTSLCGNGPIYLLFSTDASWGSGGNFANSGAGSRYFSTEITDVNGLTTTTEYEYLPNSLSGADGDYAEFEYCAAPAYNYGNDGCSVRDVTLPVELLYFEAVRKDFAVDLVWETASEINNDKFVVMRSVNGESYKPIGEVKGQGNSSVLNKYTFTDMNPQIGDNYYRIYQYDFDGSFDKSEVKLVEFSSYEDFTPVSIENTLEIRFSNLTYGSFFEIYTIEGKLVKQLQVSDRDGLITLDLPTEQQYIIRLVTNNNSVVKKIVH